MVDFAKLNDNYFLYQLDEIKFTGVQLSRVVLKKVISEKVAVTLFDEVLSGDIGYEAYLRDVYSLLFPYFDITSDGVKMLKLSITVDSTTKVTNVLFSSRYIQTNYVVPATNGGLLTNSLQRIIRPDETDILQFDLFVMPPTLNLNVSLETVYGHVDRVISVSDGEKIGYNVLEVLVSLKSLVTKINPEGTSLYISADDIISFSIGAQGEKLNSVSYYVDRSLSDQAGQFLYVNEFGRIESVTIPGVVSRKVSVSSSRNIVGNTLVADNRKDSVEYLVETAFMQPPLKQKVQQMFLSPKVWISGTKEDPDEIILSDIVDETLSDGAFLYSAKFKYRYTNILNI